MTEAYQPPVDEALFLLADALDWMRVLQLPRYRHVETDTAEAIVREAGRFTSRVLAPTNAVGDRECATLNGGRVVLPAAFEKAYKQFAANGWPGLDLPLDVGGQQSPLAIQVAFAEMLNGANVAFGMLPIMQRAGAWLLLEHADPDLRDLAVPALSRGEWAATICISEPEAGSDVGRIRSNAIPTGPGNEYHLSGSKIFISYGDHELTQQILHLVLARTPGADPGTRGLSLFAVPKYTFSTGEPNGVTVQRVERKMGLKASPTCALEFSNSEALRIGPENRGLAAMFTMVKLMRLEVAIQGVAVGEAATAMAWRHAADRRQGGSPAKSPPAIIEHPDVRRSLFDAQSRINALRALTLETAMQLDLSRFAETSDEREEAQLLADLLLPVCKACCSEAGFSAASNAVQVFGGHGYISDAGVEQYLRDARVMSIYEGTNGIQAIDLVLRKVRGDEGRAYNLLTKRIRHSIDRCRSATDVSWLPSLEAALEALDVTTRDLINESEENRVLAGASDYLRLVGLIAGAWMHVKIVAAATARSPANHFRHHLAAHYADCALPEAVTLTARVRAGDTTAGCSPSEMPPQLAH